LTFNGRAASPTNHPTWNTVNKTCTDSYCHAGSAGTNPAPVWNAPGSVPCGGCHGLPPALPHPQQSNCESCHAPVAGPNQTILIPSRHVDGVEDVNVTGCDSCHGSPGNPAPPRNLDGLGDTTAVTVGAHQTHLNGGATGRAVACETCHLVPQALNDPGHIDSAAPAELTFTGLALADGATPAWSAPTCTNTYCHGQGGAFANPDWTVVDGTQIECGGCHAMPPNTPVHQSNADCANCHLPTAGPNQTIANRATHVDGVVQVAVDGCTGCHGSEINVAPPVDTFSRAATTLRTVGAHQAHVVGGNLSLPVACDTCHLVPQDVNDPGHRDSGPPAEVQFQGRAVLDGSQPVWVANAATCANTYCHGVGAGGTVPDPVWTQVDGSQSACGTCHAMPPPAPHPANQQCELCHAPTAGPNMRIADRTTHVDGIVQVTGGDCTSCHGTTDDPAPPLDTSGNTATTFVTVGAHQAHLNAASGIAVPVACNQCHVVPTDVNSPGHIDTPAPAEVALGGLALTGGATVAYDANTLTCSGTYCHGSAENGATNPNPHWAAVDGTGATCGSCHGLPPPPPHPDNDRCSLCHSPTAGPDQTIADPRTHVDGVLQVTDGTCIDCHGGGDNSAPPPDVDRATDTTLRSVGAHRA
ncbi:MAG: CxxxxCH/CxxCH domain-containing protein, partial [Myxococcales bacterium]|nr:CxxxxCH/CxxCH domain-containing protein [Myxococcales bacterium]